MEYLVKKYLPEREDLTELVREDTDSIKYVMAQISKCKKKEYDNDDRDIIKEIAFYYIWYQNTKISEFKRVNVKNYFTVYELCMDKFVYQLFFIII